MQIPASACQDLEPQEISLITGRKTKWCKHLEDTFVAPHKVKSRIPILPSSMLLGIYPPKYIRILWNQRNGHCFPGFWRVENEHFLESEEGLVWNCNVTTSQYASLKKIRDYSTQRMHVNINCGLQLVLIKVAILLQL